MQRFKAKKGGLPNINLLYLVVVLVLFGLLAINVGLNLVWLRPFINDLQKRLVNFELIQAKRGAEAIEKSINYEIKDIKELSQDIAIVGKDSELSELLAYRFLKEKPAVKEISIIDLNGQEEKRYSRREYFSPEDLRDFALLEEFEKAKQGEIYISRVSFTSYAEPFIIITTPVRKLEIEDPQATVRILFYLRGIWGLVLETKIGETGRLSIINDKGMLIADPNPSRVLRKSNLITLPPVKPILLGEIFGGDKYLNEKGVEVIGVGVPIKSLKWGVIVEQEVSEIEAPVEWIRSVATIFLITGIMVAGILIWLVAALRKADKNLIKRYRALGDKTKELKKLTDTLEKRVKQRTEELQVRINQLERFRKITVGRELKMIELKGEIKKLKKELPKKKK